MPLLPLVIHQREAILAEAFHTGRMHALNYPVILLTRRPIWLCRFMAGIAYDFDTEFISYFIARKPKTPLISRLLLLPSLPRLFQPAPFSCKAFIISSASAPHFQGLLLTYIIAPRTKLHFYTFSRPVAYLKCTMGRLKMP